MAKKQQESEAFSIMDSSLNCSICNKVLKEPKVLSCFHSFCKSPCLESLVVQDLEGQSLTCPTCKYYVTLSENGVAGLQDDFRANRHLVGLVEKNEIICDNDCEAKATRYCRDCPKFMCEECNITHGKWEDFREHQILTTTEVRDNPGLLMYDETPKCRIHNLDAWIFCKTCKILICDHCTKGMHEGHDVNDDFEKSKHDLVSSLTGLEKKLQLVEKNLRAFHTAINKMNNHDLYEIIDREIGRLQQLLEKRREFLVAKVGYQMENELKKLKNQEEDTIEIQEKMSRCLKYIKDSIENGTKVEIVKMKTLLFERIQEIDALFQSDTIQPQEQVCLELVTNEQTSKALEEFGEIVHPNSAENSCATGDGLKICNERSTGGGTSIHGRTH